MFFPLGFLIEFDYRDRSWFHDSIRSDAAYLHLTVSASEVFTGSVLGRQNADEVLANRRTMLHFAKGVQILRERLTGVDLQTKISDFTVRTVLMLAMTAHLMGDSEVAQKHMEGIRTIMDLRGGLRLFESQKMLIELFRWDLGLALQNNTSPIFFRDTFLEPLTPFPTILEPTTDQINNPSLPQFHLDPALLAAFHVLQNFCSLINTSIAETPQRRLYPDIIPSTLSSVMYPLLQMPFPMHSNNEAFRLGLLTFCHHAFLQWQDKTLPFVFFPASYQPCLLSLMEQCQHHQDVDDDDDSSALILWLLVVGILALPPLPSFRDTDFWLKGCLREWLVRLEIRTWEEMREIMKRFLWMDLMHDLAGEGVFGDVLEV
ncbi:hypothetical protein AbraIFM66951_004562 [Aspergillus brasiliensis]|uniref:Transcription factor domain-containing protein n=1 Tax=Aspergillus brasiliensis TaxID=319629 RepID=A0A9W5YWC5_9EURO|nr:hypothetical protein AbraCBS73388_010261 [Aspergillus brasiliensis]GKZ50870.1 hypothetical protein AbraIFM66951_004562 [Aspergillus brasiliensis]